jgi:hypothetical protein
MQWSMAKEDIAIVLVRFFILTWLGVTSAYSNRIDELVPKDLRFGFSGSDLFRCRYREGRM